MKSAQSVRFSPSFLIPDLVVSRAVACGNDAVSHHSKEGGGLALKEPASNELMNQGERTEPTDGANGRQIAPMNTPSTEDHFAIDAATLLIGAIRCSNIVVRLWWLDASRMEKKSG